MKSVYLLEHSYEIDEIEETKTIGIYSTKENAERAIEKFKYLPGFRDYPDDFCISEYPLDKNHWEEGFITWEEAMEEFDKENDN